MEHKSFYDKKQEGKPGNQQTLLGLSGNPHIYKNATTEIYVPKEETTGLA